MTHSASSMMLAVGLSLALAAPATMAGANPLSAGSQPPQAASSATGTQSTGTTTRRQGERRGKQTGGQGQAQAPVDCHRDVRTHRIDGVMVTHRHVGPNCEVRVVRRSTVPR